MLLLELVGKVHVLLLSLILAHALLGVPGVPLGFSLNILQSILYKDKDNEV